MGDDLSDFDLPGPVSIHKTYLGREESLRVSRQSSALAEDGCRDRLLESMLEEMVFSPIGR